MPVRIKTKMKKVLISGCTGQDGSYMAEYLLKNTDNTLILAARRTSQAILGNIQHLLDNPRVKLITLDLMDSQAIRKVIKEELPDYFINLGAQTFVSDSWHHPEQHMQVNAISLIHILEAVREYKPLCRVYSSGSSEQFGDVKYVPQDIMHPYSPRSMYGVSKCSAAMICKVYRESYGTYVVHGILYNHESERRQDYFVTRKITKGVARIKKAVQAREKFEPIELGNLEAKRDWSHAKDFVDGIWRMLNQDKYRSDIDKLIEEFDRSGKLLLPRDINPTWHRILVENLKEYILASGETHSIGEFIELAFKEAQIRISCGKDENNNTVFFTHINNSFIPIVKINPKFYRPADVEILQGDSSLAREELGWEPKVSFQELVSRMVKNDLKD